MTLTTKERDKKHELMKAMNIIVESLNDEELHEGFLEWGVADVVDGKAEDNCLIEDFDNIATTFAKTIRAATRDGYSAYLYINPV